MLVRSASHFVRSFRRSPSIPVRSWPSSGCGPSEWCHPSCSVRFLIRRSTVPRMSPINCMCSWFMADVLLPRAGFGRQIVQRSRIIAEWPADRRQIDSKIGIREKTGGNPSTRPDAIRSRSSAGSRGTASGARLVTAAHHTLRGFGES